MRRWRVPVAGAAAVLVLVAIYVMAFHQPRSKQMAGLTAETNQLRSEQVPLKRGIEALETVEAREPEFRAALGLLEQLIPSGLAQPSLLVEMQTAAQAAGVELVSVTFGDPTIPKEGPKTSIAGTVLVAMPMTVVVDGPFGGIATMLRRIESDKGRAVLVGGVAVAEAEAGFPQLTGTWTGQAYALLRTDDPLLVDPDAPPAPTTATTAPSPEKP